MSNTYAVDQARWANMTIAEQMGNIYSEVGRSFAALRRHNITDRDHAVIRAIDLFDATVMALVAKKSPRTKEVLRAKDQFLQAVYGENTSGAELSSLDQYFLHFALFARHDR